MESNNYFELVQKISSTSIYAVSLIADVIPVYTGGGAHGIKSLATILDSLEKSKKSRFVRAIDVAQNDGVLTLSDEKITLTALGRRLVQHHELEKMCIEKQAEWNGVWQIIGYDIPDSLKKSREAFRRKLKLWDFLPVQESIWTIPWECREQVALIAREYGISPFVLYLHAYDLPDEKRYREYYNI